MCRLGPSYRQILAVHGVVGAFFVHKGRFSCTRGVFRVYILSLRTCFHTHSRIDLHFLTSLRIYPLFSDLITVLVSRHPRRKLDASILPIRGMLRWAGAISSPGGEGAGASFRFRRFAARFFPVIRGLSTQGHGNQERAQQTGLPDPRLFAPASGRRP